MAPTGPGAAVSLMLPVDDVETVLAAAVDGGATADGRGVYEGYGSRNAWFIDPFGLGDQRTVDAIARPFADLAASAVSAWFNVLLARPTAAVYRANAPAVNRFVAEQAIDPEAIEVPPQFSVVSGRPRPPVAPTQTEEWHLVPTAPVREPALV